MLPEQTITYRVYKDGKTLLGTSTVDMPELSWMTETLSGAGIAGELEVPTLGMTSSMSVTLNWISQSENFYKVLDPLSSCNLELRASVQRVEEVSGIRVPQSLRLVLLTMPKTAQLGSLETGKSQGGSTEFEVSRLYLEIGGKEKLLIDKVAFIHRVDGKDMLAAVRSQVGLEY